MKLSEPLIFADWIDLFDFHAYRQSSVTLNNLSDKKPDRSKTVPVSAYAASYLYGPFAEGRPVKASLNRRRERWTEANRLEWESLIES